MASVQKGFAGFLRPLLFVDHAKTPPAEPVDEAEPLVTARVR
jgi:hypothetical protein